MLLAAVGIRLFIPGAGVAVARARSEAAAGEGPEGVVDVASGAAAGTIGLSGEVAVAGVVEIAGDVPVGGAREGGEVADWARGVLYVNDELSKTPDDANNDDAGSDDREYQPVTVMNWLG